MTPELVRWKAEGRNMAYLEAPRAEKLQNHHNITVYSHPEPDREGNCLHNRHLLGGALRVKTWRRETPEAVLGGRDVRL